MKSAIGWTVQILTALLGLASAWGVFLSIKSIVKSLRVFKNHGESLGLTLSTASLFITAFYSMVVVAAFLSSEIALYKTAAVLTFIFGIALIIPLAGIGINYYPDTAPYYLAGLMALLLFSAIMFWGAKHITPRISENKKLSTS